MPALVCHLCGASLEVNEPVARDAECPACRGDVRCCRNCRHYDERMNNACTETQADPVPEKSRRNFCEFFYFSREPVTAAGGGAKRESDARAKLNALFGGGAAKPSASSDAKARLDALFKKPEPGDSED